MPKPSSAKPASPGSASALSAARPWLGGLLVGLALGSAGVALLPCAEPAGEGAAAVSQTPAPLRIGHDACSYCRMVVGRSGFAARLRHPSGREATFDDIGCLVRALESAALEPTQVDVWVEDKGGSGWVPVDEATLVELPAGNGGEATPMGYGVLAFADADAARAFATSEQGSMVTLAGLCATLRAKYDASLAK